MARVIEGLSLISACLTLHGTKWLRRCNLPFRKRLQAAGMTQNIRAFLPARQQFPLFMIEGIRITEEDLERYMMTNLAGSPPLDILIRSSGVKRLSDFLMWQV
jgi:hypothetical protein